MKVRNMKKRILQVIVLAAALYGIHYYIEYAAYQKSISKIEITDTTAEGIPDGTYEGSSDTGFVRARVEVTVTSEKITDIRLVEHINERGQKAEAVVDEVKKKQTTNVETVSGATNSSRVILEAIQRALEEGKEHE